MLARNFMPGGTIDISYKDQELETTFAKHLGVPLLLANVTQQDYQMARAAGLNKEDGSSIMKVLERTAGATIGGDDDCDYTANRRNRAPGYAPGPAFPRAP